MKFFKGKSHFENRKIIRKKLGIFILKALKIMIAEISRELWIK